MHASRLPAMLNGALTKLHSDKRLFYLGALIEEVSVCEF